MSKGDVENPWTEEEEKNVSKGEKEKNNMNDHQGKLTSNLYHLNN